MSCSDIVQPPGSVGRRLIFMTAGCFIFSGVSKQNTSLVGTSLAVNLDSLAVTDLDCVVVAALRLLVYSQSCRCQYVKSQTSHPINVSWELFSGVSHTVDAVLFSLALDNIRPQERRDLLGVLDGRLDLGRWQAGLLTEVDPDLVARRHHDFRVACLR